jgi:hypothetical protein
MTNLEQLTVLATEVRKKKKTNLSEQELQSAVGLAAVVLRDSTADLTSALEMLDMFPAPVIAEIVQQTWADLPAERRRVFLRWITRREGDRAPKRILYAAARIIEHDPPTAIELVCSVIPREENVSQELRGDLRRAFLGKRDLGIALLAGPELNQDLVGRFCRSLFQSVDSQTPFPARQALSRVCVDLICRRGATDPIAVQLVSALEGQLRMWPPEARSEFAQYVRNKTPELAKQLRLEERKSVEAPIEGPPRSPGTALEEDSDQGPRTGGIRLWLSQRIKHARLELQGLVALERAVADVASIESLEKQLDVLKSELLTTQESLEAERTKTARLAESLERGEQIRARLEMEASHRVAELDSCRQENSRLGAQITGHASTSVEEFKNRLALTLAKLITDLPDRGADVDVNRSRFLLRQYHQFIDKLEENGVLVRTRRSVKQ